MVVHQILSGAGPHDAVTSQAMAFRSLFEEWGWGGHDYAVSIDPRAERRVRPLGELDAQPGDTLLLHYSAYAPKLRRVLGLPNRKVLLSHNVTPAKWFWDYEPTIAIHCMLGRRELPRYAEAADVVAGVSLYNARELGSEEVVPILFDAGALGEPGPEPPPGPPTVLFVGRLAPHKRQDEVIRAFALLRRHRVPDARLVLVGEPLNPNYGDALRALADDLAPGAVTIESSLSRAALADRYRSAHAFLCLSEHEGFCIPLLEAFWFGVPVVSRPVGGIPEVAGDAALLVDDPDLAVVAELTAMAIEDAGLRATLRARGRGRLAAFEPAATAEKLRALLSS
jgi:glycosyltransferase involved in cell wall biosynthesis